MTSTTLTGHLSWNTELHQEPTGENWLILGLVIEDDPRPITECGLVAGDRCDVLCRGFLADEVAGLPAGTTVEVDVDRPRERTWMTRDGDVHSGIQYRGLAVRVVEPSSRSGVVRNILAAEPADDVLG